MNRRVKTRINLSFADKPSVMFSGETELRIVGRTARGVTHEITVTLAPSSIGHLAGRLIEAVQGQQERLDATKKRFQL